MSYNLDAQVFETQIVVENNMEPAGSTTGSIINKGSLSTQDTFITGQTVINNVDVTPNLNDIIFEKQATLLNNQNTYVNIAGFSFDDSLCTSFKAIINVTVSGVVDGKHAVWEINGLYKPTGWVITSSFTGDLTGVQFSIVNNSGIGQIQYTNSNTSGTTIVRYRANTTAPPGTSPIGVSNGIINSTSGNFVPNSLMFADTASTITSTDLTYTSNVFTVGGASRIVGVKTDSFVNFSNGGAITSMGDASVAKKIIVGEKVGIATTAPGYALDVVGDINFTGTFYKNNSVYSGSEIWNTNGANVFYTAGNVGLGMTNPSHQLDVNGGVKTSAGITTSTLVSTNVTSGSVSSTNVTATNGTVSNLVTSSFTGANMHLTGDLSVGGKITTVNITTTNIIDTNISAGNVVSDNVKTTSLSAGSILASGNATFGSNVVISGPSLQIPTGNIAARPAAPTGGYIRYNTETQQFEGYGPGNAWGSLGGVVDIAQSTKVLASASPSTTDGNLYFYTVDNERMRITSSGNIGIGTTAPGHLLDVRGVINSTSVIASNASISNLILSSGVSTGSAQITNANITNVTVSNINSSNVSAVSGTISNVVVTGVTSGTVTGTNANITNVSSTAVTAGTLVGTNVNVTNVSASVVTAGTLVSTNVNASSGISTGTLTATNATATTVTAGTLVNTNAVSTNVSAGTLNLSTGITAASAHITNANVTTQTVGTASVTNIISTNSSIGSFVSGSGTVGGHLVPSTNITYDLGSSTQRWRDIYLSGNTIHLGDKQLSLSGDTFQVDQLSSLGLTTGSLLNTNAVSTNITSATLNLSTGVTAASAQITNANVTTQTVGTALATNIIATTLTAATLLNTNAVSTNVSAGTLNLSTGITAAAAQFTNANATTLTAATLLNTNAVSTNVSAGTLNLSTGVTAASAQITNANVTTQTIGTALATNVSATTLTAGTLLNTNAVSTNISSATLNASTGITAGSAQITNANITTQTVGTQLATNVSATTVTAATLLATNQNATNITASTLNLTSGIIAVNAQFTNSTSTNLVATTVSAGTLLNTNQNSTNISSATLNASTGITAASAQITNANVTTQTVGTALATNLVASVISAGTLVGTTITGANLSLSGNLVVGGTLTTVNITTTNVVDTNISVGTLTGTNVNSTTITAATLINTNAVSTNISSATLNLSTGVTAASAQITNANATTLTAATLLNTNAVSTNVSAGTLNLSTGVTAASARITNSNVTTETVGTVLATNVSATNATIGVINATGITVGNMNFTGSLYQNGVAYSSSQWLSGANGILSYTSGNVGIGTTSPRSNLELTQSSTTTGMMLYGGADDGGVNRVIFNHSSHATLYQKVAIQTQSLGVGQFGRSNFGIQVNTAGDSTVAGLSDTRFFIQGTSGNVGIATTAPTHVLDVNGGMRSTTSTITNLLTTNVSSATLNLSTGVTAASAQITNANVTTITAATIINTNQNSTNVSSATLNLSTGITAAAAQFTNANATTLTAATIINTNQNSTNISSATLNASTGITTGTAQITSANATNMTVSNAIYGAQSGYALVFGGGSGSAIQSLGASNRDVGLYSWGGAGITVAQNTGYVGVGTTSPGSSLHVAGTLPVSPVGSGVHMGIDGSGNSGIQLNAGTVGSGLSYIDFAYGSYDSVTRIISSNINQSLQFSVPNGSIFLASTGNVAIGNTSPSTTLDITGTAKFTTSVTTGALNATNSTVTNAVATTSSAGTAVATTYTGGSMSLSGNLTIAGTLTTVNITTTNISETNVSAGSVSATNIGVTTITAGTARITNDIVTNMTVSNAIWGAQTSDALLFGGSNGSSIRSLGTNNRDAGFYSWGGFGITVAQSTGWAGIGTTSPAHMLDVNGRIRASSTSGILIGTSADTTRAISALDSGMSASTNNWITVGRSADTNNQAELGFNYIGTGSTSNSVILGVFGTQIMRLRADGNVGISTSTPRANLEITQSSSTTGVMLYSGLNDGGVNSLIFNHSNDVNSYRKIAVQSQAIGSFARGNLALCVNTAGDTSNVSMSDARLFIGGTSGNVGIGTTSPQSSLHVAGSVGVSPTGNGVHMGIDSNTYAIIQLNSSVGSYIDFSTSGVDSKGRILYDNTSNYLDIFTNDNQIARFTSTGNFICTGDVTAFGSLSDRRLKENVENINSDIALDTVRSLRPVTFDWRGDIFNKAKQNTSDVGFIAQEVEAVVPEAVSDYEDISSGQMYKSIKHERLIPYLVGAIQRLESVIEQQQEKIQELEKRLQ